MVSVNWEEVSDFAYYEFDDGGPEPHPDFIDRLQLARSICRQLCKDNGYPDIPFVINTGSRSESKNRQVGGKPDSTHLYGRACDINADTSRSRYFIVKSLLLAGFTRIGVYKDDETYIHVDDGDISEEVDEDAHVLW